MRSIAAGAVQNIFSISDNNARLKKCLSKEFKIHMLNRLIIDYLYLYKHLIFNSQL